MTSEGAKELYEQKFKERDALKRILETANMQYPERQSLLYQFRLVHKFLQGVELGKQLEREYRFL